jgi:hypothetical protein
MILHLVDLKEGVVIKWASCGGCPTEELLGLLDIDPTLDPKMRFESRDADVDNLNETSRTVLPLGD